MMKLKIIVAFVLFIVTFFIGSIFLMNFLKTPLFVYIYFIFSLILLISISLSLKKAYPENIELLFLSIFIILIAVSLTLFGSSVKTYYDKNAEFMKNNQALSYQLDNITRTNDYYYSYISFINDEIVKTQQARLDLQTELEKLIEQKRLADLAAIRAANQDNNEPIIQSPAPNDTNPPIILNKEEEEDGEEEYD